MHRGPSTAMALARVKRALVGDHVNGLALLTLAAVYFATGRLGLSLGAAHGFATLMWLPSGLAVAALFLCGSSLWPAITLGAFLVNLFTGAPVPVAVGIGIGNTLEALVCVALLKRERVCPRLDSLHDMLVLILVAAPIGALISATCGVGSLSLGGVIPWSVAPVTWSTWWLGDVVSIVLVTPLLLTWSTWSRTLPSRKRLVELSLISILVVAVGLFVYLGLLRPTLSASPFNPLVFPLLIWAALRFGPRGATAVIATFATLAMFGTVEGVSLFSEGSLWLRLFFLQSFLGITAATTLILAAIVAERHTLEQRKDEFISLASHELRTPLTCLLGYAQLAQSELAGSGHPLALGMLASMEAQAEKLARLIADLLDLSKIQAGNLTFAEEAVDVDALVREVVEQLQQTRTQHQINIEGSAPGTIVGDRGRLGQVVINLLTNAMKYSPQAEQIIVHLTSATWALKVSVQDFGIGIPPSEQGKIFERFYRVPGEQKQAGDGLGVGLFIAYQIIEHHGGKLWVESLEGHGATFSFSLPLESPQGRRGNEGDALDEAASGVGATH
jgi:signal transduction histidine kinase